MAGWPRVVIVGGVSPAWRHGGSGCQRSCASWSGSATGRWGCSTAGRRVGAASPWRRSSPVRPARGRRRG